MHAFLKHLTQQIPLAGGLIRASRRQHLNAGLCQKGEEPFLAVQPEPMPSYETSAAAKTVELLPVDVNDLAQIAIAAQNGAKDIVELEEIHGVGTETTRITMGFIRRRTARNIKRGDGFNHLLRLPGRPDPDFFCALRIA